MKTNTPKQIIAKSTLVKAVLENILADIHQDRGASLSCLDVSDLSRAVTSCDQLIDLGIYLKEQSEELKAMATL